LDVAPASTGGIPVKDRTILAGGNSVDYSEVTPTLSIPRACRWCGLLQAVPTPDCLESGMTVRCARCECTIEHAPDPRMLDRTAAFALAALLMYPPAMLLPVLELRKLGHARSSNIWSGTVELLAHGQYVIGTVVFVCSVVIPIAKIFGMLALWWTVRRQRLGPMTIPVSARTRAMTYRAIEWVGRWGMLDVLLVAVLVAAVKLGDWMDVAPGPGVAAYAMVVIFSLLSSASFDPHAIWEDEN
jgi:paraquat-inducible protein A